jgi:hypothetical protein
MPTLPPSLAELLDCFRACFTAPTFQTLCALTTGFLAQTGPRTITGMLADARLAGRWHHSRAHRFFSHARWSADQVGLALLEVITARLLGPGAPLRLVVDDTLFHRSGRKVFGVAWHHDPAAKGGRRIAWGNNWVVLGVLVHLPFLPQRAVCLPLWPGVFGTRPVQVVLVRPPGTPDGYDLDASAAELVARYAARWSIEVCFEEARQLAGVGQARNRTRRAVECTVSFGFCCLSLAIVWYALAGQPARDLASHRARAPWYTTKQAVSVADMLAAFRRALIAAGHRAGQPLQPTPTEILEVQAAWAAAGL